MEIVSIKGDILFFADVDSVKRLVELAIRNKVNLSEADLRWVNLSGADLSRANLSGANLLNTIMPSPTQPTSLKEAALFVCNWLRGRWIQGKWIDTPDGAYAGDCKACLHGAASYIGGNFGPELSQALSEKGFTIRWNDEEGRTEAEACEALMKIADE
mgnify:CR=1 FL=1